MDTGSDIKTRPETQEQMVFWLAQEILDLTPKIYEAKTGVCNPHTEWIESNGYSIRFETNEALTGFIDSPVGFCAVWEIVEKKLKVMCKRKVGILFTHTSPADSCCICFIGNWSGKGKDHQQSFYNAVYDALEGVNNDSKEDGKGEGI